MSAQRRGGPRAQHPIAQAAESARAQNHTRPLLAQDELPEGQRNTLAERIDGAIGGLLQDEVGLKEATHRVRRICQAEVCQRIAEERVAEVVGGARRRHRRGGE